MEKKTDNEKDMQFLEALIIIGTIEHITNIARIENCPDSFARDIEAILEKINNLNRIIGNLKNQNENKKYKAYLEKKLEELNKSQRG